MLLMGGVFFSIGRHLEAKSLARHSWPSTQATVISCGLSAYRKDGETRDEQDMVTSFKYAVEGRPYAFTSRTYVGWASDGFSGPYPYTAGQQVTLYFDPLDPSDQSLTNEPDTEPIFVWTGVLCGFIALPFLFFGARYLLRNLSRSKPTAS